MGIGDNSACFLRRAGREIGRVGWGVRLDGIAVFASEKEDGRDDE